MSIKQTNTERKKKTRDVQVTSFLTTALVFIQLGKHFNLNKVYSDKGLKITLLHSVQL